MVAKAQGFRALTAEDVKEAWGRVEQAKLRAEVAGARAAEAEHALVGAKAWARWAKTQLGISRSELQAAEFSVETAEADAKVAELGARNNRLKAVVIDESSRSVMWQGLAALAIRSPAQFDFLARLANSPGVEVPLHELGGKRAKGNRHRLVKSLVAHGADKSEVESAIEATAEGYVLRVPMETVDVLPAPKR